MSSPTKTAQNAWQSNAGEDFIQLSHQGGGPVAWIDANGVGQGALAVGEAGPKGDPGTNGTNGAPGADGSLQAPGITQTNNVLSLLDDTIFYGPNPCVDIRRFGVRALNASQTPAIAGLTASISSSSNTATISNASSFKNGDGVVIYGAGDPHSLSTPNAPTVTASLASAPTGTGYVVVAPTGSTTYNYVIIARNKAGGLTTSSSTATITNGAASLGSQSVSITSSSRTNTLVTVTTSSAHGLSVGAMVLIKSSANAQFNGWFIVSSVPDTSTFKYSCGLDASLDASSSSTGGTVYWFNCNHLVLPTPTTGVWQYYIYGRTGSTLSLIGVSMPVVAGISDDVTYMVWDDFGSPMMDGITLPGFVPATAPNSATSNNLVTTIASGAGSTTLTLAGTAGTTVSGATILFDNAPNIIAAMTSACNSTGGGGTLVFPAITSQSGVNLSYVTNSFVDLVAAATAGGGSYAGILQAGQIDLGDTVVSSGWKGANTQGTLPSFSLGRGIPLNTGAANPGIVMSGGNFEGITFTGHGNAYNCIFLAPGSIPTATFNNNNFVGSGSADLMGVHLYMFAQAAAGGSAGIKFVNNTFSSAQSQVDGSSATPLFISKNFGEITFEGLMLNRRGVFFKANQTGLNVNVDMQYEHQGSIMPMFSFYAEAGSVGGWLKLAGLIPDTSSQPVVFNSTPVSAVLACLLSIDTATFPGSGMLLSGQPFSSVLLTNMTGPPSQVGQSKNTFLLNSAGAASVESRMPLHFPSKSSLFWDLGFVANVSAAVSSGGNVPIADYKYAVVPVGYDGGVGPLSPSTTVSVTSGQQTVTVTWTALVGAKAYNIYRNNGSSWRSQSANSMGVTGTTYVDSFNYSDEDTQGTVTGGFTSLNQAGIVSPTLLLSGATPTVPTGAVAFGTTTAASATSGAATLPGNPLGFLEVNLGGTMVKIPYYSA